MEKLTTIHTDITINAIREKVWDTLYTRFGDVHLYNPSLDGSHFTKGSKGAVECERQCDLNAKTKIVERIIKAEELKKFTVDIYDGNMPMMKRNIVDIELVELSPNRTSVMLTANFSTNPAFMSSLMKGMFRAKLKDMLIGLKYYLETGKSVSKKTYTPIARKFKGLTVGQSF